MGQPVQIARCQKFLVDFSCSSQRMATDVAPGQVDERQGRPMPKAEVGPILQFDDEWPDSESSARQSAGAHALRELDVTWQDQLTPDRRNGLSNASQAPPEKC